MITQTFSISVRNIAEYLPWNEYQSLFCKQYKILIFNNSDLKKNFFLTINDSKNSLIRYYLYIPDYKGNNFLDDV